MKRLLVLIGLAVLICAFLVTKAQAQEIKNVTASFVNNRVTLYYDLNGTENAEYQVQVYSSFDGYNKPLELVKGEVGEEILIGKGKRINWNAEGELHKFQGELTFKIVAKLSAPPLELTTPLVNKSFRMGNKIELVWIGGLPQRQVELSLYKDGKVVTKLAKMGNSGSISWKIPKNILPSTNYQVIIQSGHVEVESVPFTIKPALPIYVKLSPLALLGAAIPFIGKGNEGGGANSDNWLPGAPSPGN